MKTFEDVWHDIQIALKTKQPVPTICRTSVNDIIEVSPNGIRVSSRRSKTGKVRSVSKDDFKYVWKILSTEGICTLDNLPKIIGKRSITCAILGKLRYIDAECDRGRISLKLEMQLLTNKQSNAPTF